MLELLSAFPKARIHIADNFWNSAPAVLDRLRELAGPDAAARLTASRVDLRDRDIGALAQTGEQERLVHSPSWEKEH